MIELIKIVIFVFLTTMLFWSAGKIITNTFLKDITTVNPNENQVFNIFIGIIFISILSLIINFIYPLEKKINTLIFIIIIFYGFFKYQKEFNKNFFLIILPIILISSLFIYKSNNFMPDAALYHLPFIKIINSEKIIFGLSNLHFRFGHISIIQYSSAFLNNFIFIEKGITIMPALISGTFLTFITYKLLNFKTINFLYLLIFFILAFSVTHLDRYSNYGNDVPGFIFGTLSIIYYTKYIFEKKEIFLFISLLFIVFSFLIKPFLIILVALPGYIIFIKFIKRKKIDKKFFILPIIIFLWLLKTTINTGCLVYPMKITCFDNLSWADKEKTEFYEIAGEAASKGYMDLIKLKKDKEVTMDDFNDNFTWTKIWFKNHFFIIINKISPYLLFIIIYLLFCIYIKDKSRVKKLDKKIHYMNFFLVISVLYWFLKFPIYRYGVLFIILTLTISTIIFFSKIITKNKLININKKIIFFLITVLVLINGNRIANSFSNPAWPEVFLKHSEGYQEIFKKGMFVYTKSRYMCMYNRNLCSHREINFEDLIIHKNYKFFITRN
tara:strand:- start:4900 stop:6561 length:1662 start_codon:yes stop_codon:yes gene_type:complete